MHVEKYNARAIGRMFNHYERQEGDGVIPPNRVNDCPDCPRCGAALDYDYVRYAHVGYVHCEKCGFASPAAAPSPSTATPRTP